MIKLTSYTYSNQIKPQVVQQEVDLHRRVYCMLLFEEPQAKGPPILYNEYKIVRGPRPSV